MKLPYGRIAMLLVALTLAGASASALGIVGGSSEARNVALRDIRGLLQETGGVVVDGEGRRVLGPDGKPLRVAPDGRTIVDSRGRPVRDRSGRPLTVARARRGGGRADRRAGDDRARRRRGARPAPRRRSRPRPARRPRPSGGSPAARGPVVIGATYQDADRHNAYMNSFPGTNSNAADPRAQIEATVDHINRTGGIAGRRVELRLRAHDYTDKRPIDQTVAETCAFFREGERPLAVINQGARAYALAPCLEAAGIPLITHWPSTPPSDFPGTGSLYSPSGLALDRFASVYVGGLQRAGFVRRANKIGLAWHGAPGFDEAAEAVKNELKRLGIPVVAEYRAAELGSSEADRPRLVAETSSAVVEFRRKGVDRVLTVDNFGGTIGLIGLACHAQGGCGWRYGLSSLNAPAKIAAGAASLDSDQLKGAVGVGWSPLLDIGDDPDPSPTLRTCREIMASRGVDVGDSSVSGQYSAYGFCDDLLALRGALEGRDPSPAAVRSGFAELTGFRSALTLGTALGNGRRDGAGRFRMLRWHGDCECFRYEGETFGG